MHGSYKERMKTKDKKKPSIMVPDLEDEPTRTSDEQKQDRKIIKRNMKRKAAIKSSTDAEKRSVAPIKRRLKNKGKLDMKKMMSETSAADEPRKKMKGLYGDWLG